MNHFRRKKESRTNKETTGRPASMKTEQTMLYLIPCYWLTKILQVSRFIKIFHVRFYVSNCNVLTNKTQQRKEQTYISPCRYVKIP
jgi:hypothetical protein